MENVLLAVEKGSVTRDNNGAPYGAIVWEEMQRQAISKSYPLQGLAARLLRRLNLDNENEITRAVIITEKGGKYEIARRDSYLEDKAEIAYLTSVSYINLILDAGKADKSDTAENARFYLEFLRDLSRFADSVEVELPRISRAELDKLINNQSHLKDAEKTAITKKVKEWARYAEGGACVAFC